MSGEIVVYYYSDPAFRGDLGPALDDLRRRGHRVVKGDNPDELLFLLQVGRPAAVIYTMAAADSATSTAYQMVSRRVLDLLVPLILVGPDNPRDGVGLLFPEGKSVSRHHVPFHAVAALIERFAEAPPGTPSRPPEMLQNKTIGRGRTVLNWQAAASDARKAAPPDTSEIHDPPPGGVMPSRPAPLPLRPAPSTLVQVPSHKRTLVAGSVPPPRPADEEPAAGPPAPAPHPAAVAVIEPPREEEPSFADQGRGRSRAAIWLLAAGLVAVLFAMGAVIWFATRPAAPPPRPVTPTIVATAISKPAAPLSSEPVEVEPTTAAKPSVPEEPAGEIERPVDAVPASPAAATSAPSSIARGTPTPFAGRFRENTALFWFGDDAQPEEILASLNGLDPLATLRITGHPTESEAAAGLGALGSSRAWAVGKWLARQGIDPARIVTVRGRAVSDRGYADERGVPLNNWVTITIE